MENIIAPVDRKKLLEELSDDKLLRTANYCGNKIYVFQAGDSPFLMQEIGRLREISFREAGGGTGKKCDIDSSDLSEKPYSQLIVWNDTEQEILGGYRFKDLSKDVEFNEIGQPELSTAEIFKFSDTFIKEYMPQTIELGRSFVQPKYQSRNNSRLGLFALDGLWDGLGAVYRQREDHIKYFFGKVTMYTTFNKEARDYILAFLSVYFYDRENLITADNAIKPALTKDEIKKLFSGTDYKKDYKTLNHLVRSLGENIPPLLNAYMNLSPTTKIFPTVTNPFFGGVEETGILVKVDDILPEKKARHLDSYIKK